jgi:hypothetical protein
MFIIFIARTLLNLVRKLVISRWTNPTIQPFTATTIFLGHDKKCSEMQYSFLCVCPNFQSQGPHGKQKKPPLEIGIIHHTAASSCCCISQKGGVLQSDVRQLKFYPKNRFPASVVVVFVFVSNGDNNPRPFSSRVVNQCHR